MSNEKLREALAERLRQLARRQRQYGAANTERIDLSCALTIGDLDSAAEALASIPVDAADQPAAEPHPIARLNLGIGEPVTCDGAEDVERDIRIAIWNAAKWQGKPDEVAQSLIRKAMAEPTMQRALAALSAAKPVPDGMVLVSRDDLERIRRSMCLLQQNSEGCAQNHYGGDFEHHGMPGWLADTKRDAVALTALLASKDTRP